MSCDIHYLNTDLELVSASDLNPLVAALSTRGLFALSVYQRDDGSWTASLETDTTFRQPDPNINALLSAIEGLDAGAQSAWSACCVREFDVGYDCGHEPWAFNVLIAAATLARMAAAGVSLRTTIYPLRDPPRDREE